MTVPFAHEHCHLGLFLVVSVKTTTYTTAITDAKRRSGCRLHPGAPPQVGQRRNLGTHLQCSSTSSTAPPTSKLWALSRAIYSTSSCQRTAAIPASAPRSSGISLSHTLHALLPEQG
ncbi:hypothetical protein BDP55DRAFT_60593 [Colletotrichum godetiae]|uniref:Uncharacterized protein n=1 Tax=Colletotrichum godetiae TaxID=1209918 RepID=A0AAJ0APX7_9PEZI|nr:uncharacterized protein BDP55DRAFT_60593 [Colletotrichum godetiae]KAK1688215.1 hypothetical protein BDP55DRAFT_60593 [Colletotrichum godetiae]